MEKYRKVYTTINNECNYACRNCLLDKEMRNAREVFLSLDELKSAVNSFSQVLDDEVLNIWEVSGGEPTIHPEFYDIVEYISSLKEVNRVYKQVVLSNAHILSDKKFTIPMKGKVDDLVTTIYSPNSLQNDIISGVENSLSNKMKAIENLISIGVKVHVKIIIMKPNHKNLPKIARLVGENFGDSVHLTINTTHFVGDADANQKELAVSLSESARYVEETIDVAKEYGISVGIFFPICLLDPSYWQYSPFDYAEQIKRTFGITPSSKKFFQSKDLEEEFVVRHQSCNICPVRVRCNWPWQSYAKIHGEKEIVNGLKTVLSTLRR